MAEKGPRTVEQIKNTIAQLKEVLDQIDPGTPIVARGTLSFADLGMKIIYGAGNGVCNGCFGCAGCEGGCMGCANTATVAGLEPGGEVINPNPMATR